MLTDEYFNCKTSKKFTETIISRKINIEIKMKAKITFFIGLFVTLLGIIQLFISYSHIRFITISVGLFFIIFGWKIGWTKYKYFTILLGHIAVVIGTILTSYGLYQIHFIQRMPSIIELLDLPLFWGIFTIFGGNCMIKHSYCSCCIRMHEERNKLK